MCLTVDANKAEEFFCAEEARSADLRKAVFAGKCCVVYGGKLAEEYGKVQKALRIVLALDRAGRARAVPNEPIAALTEELKISRALKSDDPHIIALAQVSGSRLLHSLDGALQHDFTNKDLIDNPVDVWFGDLEGSDGEVKMPADSVMLVFLGDKAGDIRASISKNYHQIICVFKSLEGAVPKSLNEFLISMLSSSNPERNRIAVRVIGSTSQPEVIEAIKAVRDRAKENLWMDAETALALGELAQARSQFAFPDEYVGGIFSKIFEKWRALWNDGKWDEVFAMYAADTVPAKALREGGELKDIVQEQWAKYKALGTIWTQNSDTLGTKKRKRSKNINASFPPARQCQ